MTEPKDDFCTDCQSRRSLIGKASKFGAVAAVAGFLGIGGKNIVSNAHTDKEKVPFNQEELRAWIKTPGLVDSYPVDGLPQEQQDAIKQAIRDGDTTFFTKNGYEVGKELSKPGTAGAACGYYYTLTPWTCCTSRYCRCYQCNGETQWCNCSIAGGYNNCAWCGHGPSCCG
jgi:hypothetical protein